jgi:hypothetical protein
MKRRSYIVLFSIITIAAFVVIFLLNYKSVDVPGFGNINVFFGRAFKGSITSLEKHASKLITDGDFDGAKEIGEIIAKYGGDRKPVGLLIIAESNWKAGSIKESVKALSEAVKAGGLKNSEISLTLSNFTTSCLDELIKEKPFKIYPTISMLHILEDSKSSAFEKYNKDVQSLLSDKIPIDAQFIHKRNKKYLTKDSALNDVKSEGVFESKKEAPALLLSEIKKMADFDDILTDGDILEYIHNVSVYELLNVDVKKVPMNDEPLPEDIVKEEKQQLGGSAVTNTEGDYGYQGEATYIAKIPDFSIDSLLKGCKVDLNSKIEQEPATTK